MTMVGGTAAGLARGELQGALSTMQSVVRVFVPLVWSRLYQLGVKRGTPGIFYLGIALVHAARLGLTCVAAIREEEIEPPEKSR